ncbi:Hypoxanthine phosphoribosyltransferase [Desulfamplus magnetovallimortis]|uniref:Hypoxanthine phosphoribosyltransferase n=1 Tax=Desulfamplus magnetovallimortis TaxID=1246637 RepID=A0A1W1H4V6_9BACT|nr:hypoxanthine phosphoribosyltransferase [Desulfamplus magnetovallimortis]SLM27513.1 Hypoxanthine phosphoribosyltransferase [Desulfamplus magnetovallimortis]
MTNLIPIISQKEIHDRVTDIAHRISSDYKNKDFVLIGILKGSFIFLSDLTRAITIDHEIDLVGTSSYSGTETTGIIEFTKKVDLQLEGRHIILVEDIVDTGRTLAALINYFRSLNPASIKICTLINKNERRELTVAVDYACFTIEKGFIVGYGLDYNEKYRNLPAIFDLQF